MVRLKQHDKKQLHTTEIGPLKLHFSYETLVGVEHGAEAYVSAERWSATTAQHIGLLRRQMQTEPEAVDAGTLAQKARSFLTA